MGVALIVMTDGRREYLEQMMESLLKIEGEFARAMIHDDSGDLDNYLWLSETYKGFEVYHPYRRLGFGGAIANAWKMLEGTEDYILHIEDDFTIDRPVNLDDMCAVLDANPHLAQMALRRQAWNQAEIKAGGVVELHPDSYEDKYDGLDHWLEHRLFFTTNASLYRRELTERGWPAVPESEGVFSAELFTDPQVRCGYWGKREDGPWISHIGEKRAGTGY